MSAPCRLILTVVLCSVLLLGSTPLAPTRAELMEELTFTVNSFEDLDDYAGNSVCSAGSLDDPNDGPCTLRAAIFEANINSPFTEVKINLPAGTYTLTIPPDGLNDVHSGDLDIAPSEPLYTITLTGTGEQPSVIDANQLDRIFEIDVGVHVIMENIVIRGGLLVYSDLAVSGAGIFNLGNLELQRVIIENNELRCPEDVDCPMLIGGGLRNIGKVFMQDSTIRSNTSIRAAALYNDATGEATIWNSTIAGNYSETGFSLMNWNSMKIRNSTMSGNSAGTGWSGGLYNAGSLLIESSTFANKGPAASIYNTSTGTVIIQDTIFAAEPGEINCTGYLDSDYWTSLGYNIYSDHTCFTTGTGDLVNTDPLLGILGDWGGPTETIALQAGSPALNHRDGVCQVDALPVNPFIDLVEDQRHVARNDDQCDTGAFEGSVVLPKIFLPLTFK